MFKLTLVFAIASALGLSSAANFGPEFDKRFVQSNPNLGSRILGGEDAKEGEFPYQVLLRHKGKPYCGGVLIADDVILTAGHCAQNNVTRYEVAAGFINIKEPGPNLQTSELKKITVHSGYGGTGKNDIAVMVLKTPLKMTPFVQKALLPSAGQEFEGDTMLAGWGSIVRTYFPKFPLTLQKVKLPLISFDDCKKYYSQDYFPLERNEHICTGPIGGDLSACERDCGGALVKDIKGKKYVAGIVSWGMIPCGLGSPTVYTKISSYLDFINKSSK